MVRVSYGVARRHKKNRILKRAKGYVGARHRLWRIAKNAVMRADRYAFFGRRRKKRDFRSLWIQRINAAARAHGMPYSRFVAGLKRAGVQLDRKSMAELAMRRPAAFTALVSTAQQALGWSR